MVWLKLENDLPHHPKLARTRMAGVTPSHTGWLYVSALCHSSRYTTDGEISREELRALWAATGDPKVDVDTLIDALVTVRMLEKLAEDRFYIHDYLKHQKSAKEVNTAREQTRRRTDEWRESHDRGGS